MKHFQNGNEICLIIDRYVNIFMFSFNRSRRYKKYQTIRFFISSMEIKMIVFVVHYVNVISQVNTRAMPPHQNSRQLGRKG